MATKIIALLTMCFAGFCSCEKKKQSADTTTRDSEPNKVEPLAAQGLRQATPFPESVKEFLAKMPTDEETVARRAAATDAGRLLNLAMQGDAQAKRALMALAVNEKAHVLARDMAIRYLGNVGSPESLTIVAKQLLSTDPQLRTTAYYSLPENLRPTEYHYDEPDAASREIVTKLIKRIQK
jgi:HEAT repeat protein